MRRSTVGIDIEAQNRASREIDQVSRSLGTLGSSAQTTGHRFGALGSAGSALFSGVFMGVGITASMAVAQAVSTIPSAVIGMNASLEKSTLQFETLFRDADKARDHVRMLFEFAKTTPFETGPVIEASRMLQTFGGDALNTSKNLTMIGDAAAGASVDINHVSFWVGRAYAAIQGGQPFGEARMRLQELALLSPKAAQEMERLQKAGASASEVWAVMEGELGRFGGAMEKQADTWEGLTSTMSDTINLTLADAFKPFFETIKEGMRGAIKTFSDPAFGQTLRAIGDGMMRLLGIVGDVFGAIWSAAEPVVTLLGDLWYSVTNLWAAFEDAGAGSLEFNEAMGLVLDTITGFAEQAIAGLGELGSVLMDMFGNAAVALIDSLPGLLDSLLVWAQAIIDWLLTTGIPMVAQQIALLADQFIQWVAIILPKLGAALPGIATRILNFILDTLPKLAAKLVEWGMAFIGWILPRLPGIIANLASFVGSLVGWVLGTGLPRLVGAAGDLGIAFVREVLKFIIGPPGLLEKLATFVTKTLLPGMATWIPKLAKAAGDIAKGFVDAFIKFIGTLPDKIAAVITKAFKNLKIDIGPFHITGSGITIDLPKIDLPSFDVGAWRLPSDMVAMVHKDEMVIPADIARRLRGESGPTGTISRAPTFVGGMGGGVTIYQTNNFGRDSVRSDDDIRRIGQMLHERAALQGYAPTIRQVGRAVG